MFWGLVKLLAMAVDVVLVVACYAIGIGHCQLNELELEVNLNKIFFFNLKLTIMIINYNCKHFFSIFSLCELDSQVK
jgi:hypothetical protein